MTKRTPQPGDHVIITNPCEPWAMVGEQFILERCDSDGDWRANAVQPRYNFPICIGLPTNFCITNAPAKAGKAKGDRDAKWLMKLAKMRTSFMPSVFTKHAKARLRAIARRLEGKS